ncbi:DUF3221 domain-containing protein [Paenibacillus tarimensis]|uniref:DUF3221 domain-containing protein n=1 Tax=Paenibacillus tarimensis TaxID=416012 RepID=UPI001F1E0355|nr:DUF3221 domain-containing protein [Paenibacillus tarimensis]MCF2946433.1 YobA family protein [Paenibacillus tarimensis]
MRLLLFLLLIFLPLVSSCGSEVYFEGRIVQINDDSILVINNISEEDIKSNSVQEILDKNHEAFEFKVGKTSSFEVGMKVKVGYNGNVDTSYPAQAGVESIKIIK